MRDEDDEHIEEFEDLDDEVEEETIKEFLDLWNAETDAITATADITELKTAQVIVYDRDEGRIITPFIPYLTDRTVTEVFNIIDFPLEFPDNPQKVRLHLN